MKYALISSEEYTSYVSSFDTDFTPAQPVYTELGWRVAEVEDTQLFPAEMPLFWVECDDNVTSIDYYYNPTTELITAIPSSPIRPEEQ
jgi:hypothetical protein